MKYLIKDGELPLEKSRLEEKRFLDFGAKWFLVEDDKHKYVLMRNTILAHGVPIEIEPEGSIIAEGSMEFVANGSWIVPRMITEHFQTSELVIEEDSKGFFATSPEESARYEEEIGELANRISSLLED